VKWLPRSNGGTASDRESDMEIEHATHLAGRVLSHLVSHHQNIFPLKREPWFVPNDENAPR